MAFSLPPLNFQQDALEPYMSRETIQYHYEKHHQGYVDKANKLLDASQQDESLTSIILSSEGDLFNNAAQIWNHNFFWQSLALDQEMPQDEDFNTLLLDSFGGVEKFNSNFKDLALGQFGSGWAWLVYNHHKGALECIATANAETPLRGPQTPLLTLDVWEHAYYIDYRNARERYVDEFLAHLINWSFAVENMQAVSSMGKKQKFG